MALHLVVDAELSVIGKQLPVLAKDCLNEHVQVAPEIKYSRKARSDYDSFNFMRAPFVAYVATVGLKQMFTLVNLLQ
jgi:hypothetical protein